MKVAAQWTSAPFAGVDPVTTGTVAGLEYALAAILDCHTRIVAKHVPSPRVRRVRAGYRDRSLRAALALRSERR